MSHMNTSTSKLGSVNADLLKKVLEIVAKKYNGRVTGTISDYYGNELASWKGDAIVAAIKTPQVKRGIGLIIKNGKLQFVGDDYGAQSHFKALQQDIEFTYKKSVLIMALAEMGYQDIDIDTIDIGTIIKGVK